jgi:hypothetical protein
MNNNCRICGSDYTKKGPLGITNHARFMWSMIIENISDGAMLIKLIARMGDNVEETITMAKYHYPKLFEQIEDNIEKLLILA